MTVLRTNLRRAHQRVGTLLARFARDRSGSYLIMFAISLPALVGFSAFGTEEGLLLYTRTSMQHAADSAAASAAVAYSAGGTDIQSAAKSVSSEYGFLDGATQGTTVTVSQPPSSGRYTGNREAIEVIITQPQTRIFSALWGSNTIPVVARAVALPISQACVLALDPSANGSFSQQGSVNSNLVHCSVLDNSTSNSAVSVGGSARLSATFVAAVGGISGQSSITTVSGTRTGYHVTPDPYASVSFPSFAGCDKNNYSTHGTVTLNPGVYCGGISLGSGAVANLNPGIYYLDGGSLSMAGSASLSGTGVTLVFTSSSGHNYASANITGGATVNLVAPTSGPTKGIVLFGDRNMPTNTLFKFTGGNLQALGGAVYLPKGALSWAGNAGVTQHCTQVVANTIQFVGDSGLAIDCTGYGTRQIGSAAQMLE